MKGGKDEEKTMGPMFPRLHVNDTEKGGPRAPPRNKMALYEQLSVPSQRFSSGSQQINNTSNLVPSASFSQGTGQERTMFSSFRIPPHAPPHLVDTTNSRCSTEGLDLRTNVQNFEKEYMKAANDQISNPSMHFQPAVACRPFNPNDLMNSKNFFMGKLGNEDDFRVPTFVNSQKDSRLNKDQHGVNCEKLTPLSPSHPGHTTNQGENVQKVVPSTCSSSTHHQNARDKHLKRTNTTDLRSRQHSRDHSEDDPLDSATSKDSAGNTTSRPPPRENIAEHLKHAYPSLVHEQCIPTDNLEGLHDTNAHSRQECRAEFVLENITHGDGEQVLPMANGNIVWVTNKSCRTSPGNDGNESCEEKTDRLLQAEDVDRNDDASETSMVDSITVLDISPDDVVGVIGQKHFWKARRAIVNQQRLFAVQVFELHRLIKVQRLIAGSPHLLLDDTSSNKPSPKVSPPKKLTIEYALKPSQQIVKEKTESQKPGQSTECAAENAVRRPLGSDGVNGGCHSSYGPPSVNPVPAPTPTPTPVMAENKAPWFFHPPPGNQWLVPVMSPSEGLVYKPYSGPCPPTGGFMAPMYGGCGPMSMTPMGGEFPGASYGLPSPHPQGMGVLSGAPPPSQTYFSPYGMPVMNPLMSTSAVEQANAMAGARSLGQGVQLSTGEVNFNMQSRNSCNMSNQKGEGTSHLYKFQASKESERQGSTASSPSERADGTGPENVPEGRDALSLFPMGPSVQAPIQSQTHSSGPHRIRVIKVVPHNPKSATESAARIFQSIQEERQHHDSV